MAGDEAGPCPRGWAEELTLLDRWAPFALRCDVASSRGYELRAAEIFGRIRRRQRGRGHRGLCVGAASSFRCSFRGTV